MARIHHKTCFVMRSSEKSMVKAGGEKGSSGVLEHIENLFLPTTQTMGFAADRNRKRFWDGL
jgi:hypothetical protein